MSKQKILERSSDKDLISKLQRMYYFRNRFVKAKTNIMFSDFAALQNIITSITNKKVDQQGLQALEKECADFFRENPKVMRVQVSPLYGFTQKMIDQYMIKKGVPPGGRKK